MTLGSISMVPSTSPGSLEVRLSLTVCFSPSWSVISCADSVSLADWSARRGLSLILMVVSALLVICHWVSPVVPILTKPKLIKGSYSNFPTWGYTCSGISISVLSVSMASLSVMGVLSLVSRMTVSFMSRPAASGPSREVVRVKAGEAGLRIFIFWLRWLTLRMLSVIS